MSDNNEASYLLNKFLNKIQRNEKIRNTLAILLVTSLLSVAAYFIYDLLPKEYYLAISGGGILTNRHHLVKVLQSEAEKDSIHLQVEPVSGSLEALKEVSEGKLDLALIQGGLEKRLPNVDHVAMLPPEILHILVKPDMESIEDLKGKVINMGTVEGGTRIVSKKILNFFNLKEYNDFVESNYSEDELMNMSYENLPDAIITLSYLPSYFADYLIREQGYQLLNIPNAEAMAMRFVWAEKVDIQQGIYNENPPCPKEDYSSIGVKLEIVSYSKVPADAISEFLKILYSSSIENVILQTVEEESGDSFSNFPLSKGTVAYMHRNEPLFSMELVDNLKNLFGSAMAFLSTVMIVFKWFKGKSDEEDSDTDSNAGSEAKAYTETAVSIDEDNKE